MKKVAFICALLSASVVAVASPSKTVVGVNEDGYTTFTSPRTGVTYSFSNPNQAEFVFQAQEIVAATSETAQRIVAKNPALSVESQEQAVQKLIKDSQANNAR